MGTRSFIAKQIDNDSYLTIYCHWDGYLTHNGAMLLDIYNTPEMVDKLIALGDLSSLNIKLDPDPNYPHSFDYDKQQEDVTVAYGRDRNDKDAEARIMTLKELDDPESWTEYVYIFTIDNQWKFFHAGKLSEGLKDVREELDKMYSNYGITRPIGYYGWLCADVAEKLKEEVMNIGGESTNEVILPNMEM